MKKGAINRINRTYIKTMKDYLEFNNLDLRYFDVKTDDETWTKSIRKSNICVILFNILIPMYYYTEEEPSVVIRTAFKSILETERENSLKSKMDVNCNIKHIATMVKKNIYYDAKRLLVSELRFTDHDEHFRLLKYLISLNTEHSGLYKLILRCFNMVKILFIFIK